MIAIATEMAFGPGGNTSSVCVDRSEAVKRKTTNRVNVQDGATSGTLLLNHSRKKKKREGTSGGSEVYLWGILTVRVK